VDRVTRITGSQRDLLVRDQFTERQQGARVVRQRRRPEHWRAADDDPVELPATPNDQQFQPARINK